VHCDFVNVTYIINSTVASFDGRLFLPFQKNFPTQDVYKTISDKIRHTHKLSTETRGPRGPWVAHLKKKVTVEPIIENPRGII